MKDLKYIPLNAADFLSDQNVALMSTEQIGAYMLLLLYAWGQKPAGTIPNNDEWLSAWTRTTPEHWLEIKEGVMRPFELNESENRWEQPRLRDTYVNVKQTLEQKSAMGKKAANARWNPESERNADALLKRKEERVNTKEANKVEWNPDDGWLLSSDVIPVWEHAYPSIDIGKQLAKANAWLLANPSKASKYKNWKRFMNGWLNRHQDKMDQKGSTDGNKANSEYEESGIGRTLDVR